MNFHSYAHLPFTLRSLLVRCYVGLRVYYVDFVTVDLRCFGCRLYHGWTRVTFTVTFSYTFTVPVGLILDVTTARCVYTVPVYTI